jgi:hypothetical protein
MNKLLWLILFAVIAVIFWPLPPKTYGPGVTAPLVPVQTSLSNAPSFEFKDYRIQPVATFYIQARVLGVETYRFGRESDLSPVDLALGWGKMSDEAVLQHFDISQRNRWYYWRTDNFVIPRREVETSSANMHIIPASADIENQLKSVREGDLVTLSGKLVNVSADDGWRWNTSLSRNDTGQGACELIFVESISIK